MSGNWRSRTRCVLVFAVIIPLLAAGCHRQSADTDEGDSPESAPQVVMAVSGARAADIPMTSEVSLLGKTVVRKHITLRAPAAGRVLGLDLRLGESVTRGQVVAHLLSREVEAVANGLAVARQVDPSEARMLSDSARRYVHGTGIPITVPHDAIVDQLMVSSGQTVADLDPIAELIDPASVYVEANVPIDLVPVIRPGMPAVVISALHPGVRFPARIAALSPAFNQSGATTPARVEFTGPERIYETNAPAQVLVTTAHIAAGTAIPVAALFQNAASNTFYVFVAGPDGRAHRTPVHVGIRAGGNAQIVSGLTPGQIVITSGGYALSDGLLVNVQMAQQ
ncbi:MAG TPA: HlyD family efflux transporter periplasmic adaptor subunit [Candidatus Binataceae bacterium]|nr:HlyD family efflux transporter periplasmic adaptor subunit [Candidatus Binataceae bacterium]